MGIIWTILIGFVVGTVAKFLVPGREPGGFIVTTILGIAGSWVGGWIFQLLGMSREVGFIGSVIGAIVILLIYNWFNRQKVTS